MRCQIKTNIVFTDFNLGWDSFNTKQQSEYIKNRPWDVEKFNSNESFKVVDNPIYFFSFSFEGRCCFNSFSYEEDNWYLPFLIFLGNTLKTVIVFNCSNMFIQYTLLNMTTKYENFTVSYLIFLSNSALCAMY